MASNAQCDEARVERAELPPGERQLLIKNLVVDHDRSREATEALERFHFPVKGGVPDYGSLAILAGNSRTGKTFAVKDYCRRFPTDVDQDGKVFRVVYVEMPSYGGYRAILQAIADPLEIIYSARMNNQNLLRSILRGLEMNKVELLILDEFQDVFDPDKKRLIVDVRRLVRKILNAARLNIVCVGLEETYHLMARDEQITGRGGLPYRILRSYEWSNSEERDYFRLLCDQFDEGLPFARRSGLARLQCAHRLFFVTQGIIGRLKDFLYAAACLAINDEADFIHDTHLARAFDQRKPLGQRFNPFVHDMAHAPSVQSKEQKVKVAVERPFAKSPAVRHELEL